MRKIRIPIPDFTNTEKTYLDADYSSGTVLTVVNNYGFANDDIAIIGEPGTEKAESKDVTSQTGNTVINVSATYKFTHNKSEVVYRWEYDQYEIYRYRSASWSLISTSNIQWDKLETIYVDKDGLSTDSYRYRLLNSASSATSDYSPTVAATGFTRSQVGYMIREVRLLAGDTERKIIKTDDEIIRQFNRAQEIIAGIRDDWWFLRKENSQITTVAATRKYGLNTYLSDLNYIDTVRYRYDNGTTDVIYQLEQKSYPEWDALVRDVDTTGDDYPSSYVIQPADSTDETGYVELNIKTLTTGYGTFYIRYYKKMTDLDDVADETDVPIPSILEDYALMYVFGVKGDETRSSMYANRFYGPPVSSREKFKSTQDITGLRLLESQQKSKGRALGQPAQLKKFLGRGGARKLYQSRTVDKDYLAETYY